ncbi:ImmA/IrrE family metallo-endopeptidase [Rhodococcoides fascians]|uniref:ImmA/IrrE family metallo-endopeptidase n=1 Tax=Rhodococcoides fascians TaxID=1828 RepID=UPI0027800B64|nr:ImmA/IrrE family metallo-endopeptidase [Rhodococcus fascians]MDQ0284455.1 Zn-dependent peptidase ImmA (M78 family) [Rhodococcus fascians]
MEHWNTDDNKIPFPVDPFALAERLEISVQLAELDHSVSGFIVRENDGGPVEIYLNAGEADVRQRFTLAHELGHYVQRNGDTSAMAFVDERSDLASSGTDSQEVWANRFAAELLMPAAIVKKWWADGRSPDQIRRKFGVSSAAIDFRLANLGLAR